MKIYNINILQSCSLLFEYSHLVIDYDSPPSPGKINAMRRGKIYMPLSELLSKKKAPGRLKESSKTGDDDHLLLMQTFNKLVLSELMMKSKPLNDRFRKTSEHFDSTLQKVRDTNNRFDAFGRLIKNVLQK